MRRIAFSCTCAALTAGFAAAQPAATDLGALPTGPTTVSGSLAAGEIVWYTITIPTVTAPGYLDIDSEGSLLAASNDTEIGVYRSDGTLVVSDDDDGSGLLTALSFGASFPTRPAFGSGVAFDGRDGAALTAGTYYVSISGFNTLFGASGWAVTSTSPNTGSYVLNLRLDEAVVPDDWYLESTDSGDLPASASAVEGGPGPVARILGNFGTGTDSDMYYIEICDIDSFSASTVGNTTIDTQIWLFNEAGNGVVFNDDQSNVTPVVRQSFISNAQVFSNGRYYLAISAYNRDPIDAGGALLWNNTPFDGQRAPDGPAAASPIAAWTGSGGTGGYVISLTGVCYINNVPPCPGDINGDNAVNLTDLATLLTNFGLPSGATLAQGDIDGDGDVDLTDLATLLSNFGTVCG